KISEILDGQKLEEYKSSWFKLYRSNSKKDINFATSIDMNNKQYFELLLTWLGIKSFFKKDTGYNNKRFKSFVFDVSNDVRQGPVDPLLSIISFERLITSFSPHFRTLSTVLESVS